MMLEGFIFSLCPLQNFIVKKQIKFDKKNVTIIEDSPKGLAAAYASGCNVIKVGDPSEVDAELFKEYLL